MSNRIHQSRRDTTGHHDVWGRFPKPFRPRDTPAWRRSIWLAALGLLVFVRHQKPEPAGT